MPNLGQAGVFELGASTSYRKSTITKDNFSTSESYTGSLGYYFTDSSALEFSYTNGFSRAVTTEAETKAFFTVYGVDFILTIGPKGATFRPYIKLGAAQIYKEIRYKQTDMDPLPAIKSSGIAPSAGLGFRLMFTETFALKVGLEGWTSPINDSEKSEGETRETTYDVAARAGISWMF